MIAAFHSSVANDLVLWGRYAAVFPEEDGYRRAETLNEDVLGTNLWTAARVCLRGLSCTLHSRLS